VLHCETDLDTKIWVRGNVKRHFLEAKVVLIHDTVIKVLVTLLIGSFSLVKGRSRQTVSHTGQRVYTAEMEPRAF